VQSHRGDGVYVFVCSFPWTCVRPVLTFCQAATTSGSWTYGSNLTQNGGLAAGGCRGATNPVQIQWKSHISFPLKFLWKMAVFDKTESLMADWLEEDAGLGPAA